MDIHWTEKASADALDIFDYIADQSPDYAGSVDKRILERPMQLTLHPRSEAVVPEMGRDDIGELFVYSFRLICRIAGYGRRDSGSNCNPWQPEIGSWDDWRRRTMKCKRGQESRLFVCLQVVRPCPVISTLMRL
jgi:plasmid stabilization system protein ParE